MVKRMSDFTIVYSAFGRRFIREAAISAWSVKRSMPSAPTYILTNEPITCPYFDQIEVSQSTEAGTLEDQRGKSSKASAILRCLGRDCLFLDADTYVIENVSDVFHSPLPFDIAGCHDTWQFPAIYKLKSRDKRDPIHPPCHPYINTGVLFVRKNDNVVKLMKSWEAACMNEPNDQLAFADVLYKSDVRFHALPPVYNARAGEPIHLSGRLKILHKFAEADKADNESNSVFVADYLSKTELNRIYNPSTGEMKVVVPYFGIVDELRGLHSLQHEREEFLHPELNFPSDS